MAEPKDAAIKQSTPDAEPLTPEAVAALPDTAPVTLGILRAVLGDVTAQFNALTETLTEISGDVDKLGKKRGGPAQPVDPQALEAAVEKALGSALSGPLQDLQNQVHGLSANMGHALSGQRLKDHNNDLLGKGAISARQHRMMHHEGTQPPRVARNAQEASALRLEGYHDSLELAAQAAALAEAEGKPAGVTPALVQKHRKRIHASGAEAA